MSIQAIRQHRRHTCQMVFGDRLGMLAVMLLTAIWAIPLDARATAEEEPTVAAGSVKNEPVLIGETPAGLYAAGGDAEQSRRRIVAIGSYIQRYNRRLSTEAVDQISGAILQHSLRYGVDYRLLTSLIAIESSFRQDAISSSGAIGMGQLKPDTARWLGVTNPFDPIDNIAGTARFLSWLVRRYNGNLEYALSAYYQGPGFVDRNGVTSVCMPYLEKVNRALSPLM